MGAQAGQSTDAELQTCRERHTRSGSRTEKDRGERKKVAVTDSAAERRLEPERARRRSFLRYASRL